MSPSLKKIHEIYAALELGNIGKLLTILASSINVHTARCMGGNSFGREGILKQISIFYRLGSGITKTVAYITEEDNLVIVLGNIQLTGAVEKVDLMSFTDVWTFENETISKVVFYYRDPELLVEHLAAEQ